MAQSNHQPFENWIFSRETLDREEELALQEHLRQCEHCQVVSGAMQAVEHNLKSAPVFAPSPGFSTRWLVRLEEGRARYQRKQTIVFSATIIGGAAVLLVLSVLLMWPFLRSPYPYLLAVAYQLALMYTFVDNLAAAGVTVYKTIFNVVSPLMLVSLFFAMAGIVVVWIAVLRKYVYPRRVTQ